MEDLSAAELLAFLKQRNLFYGLSLPELRAAVAELYHGFDAAPGPGTSPTSDGCPEGLWIEQGQAKPGRVLLFFHGGGFTVGSAGDHASLCGRLAEAAHAKVLGIEYRLAPEHPFPAAVMDCFAAYRRLLDRGQRPGQIALAGISAGGNLTLATQLLAKREGLPLPAAAACMSPAPDMRFPGPSATANAAGDWIIPERLAAIRQVYLAGHDPDDPLASPVKGDLSGLAPLALQVGGGELLLDDNKVLAAKLAEAGSEVDFEIFPGMFHCWQLFASVLPAWREAVTKVGAFLDARME